MIAVEKFRLEHGGRLPESLQELTFADPTWGIDPFTDEPLKYRRNEVGYIVYSVGKNEVDDGGEIVEKRKDDRRDWFLRIDR